MSSLRKILIKTEGWPGLIGQVFGVILVGVLLLNWYLWLPKIIYIFYLGGFLVIYNYWYKWLDSRWVEIMIESLIGGSNFVTVYLKPHLDNAQSLASMEAFFQNFHAIHSKKSMKYAYFEGVWYRSMSFEVHSIGGKIGFFARMFESDLDLFKSALLAQYPQVEVVKCEDPLGYLPKKWVEDEGVLDFKNSLGVDFVLTDSNDMFPTKNWNMLQPDGFKVKVDPIQSLITAFESCEVGEHLILQFILRPNIDMNWNKQKQKEVEDLKKEFATNSDVEATKYGTMALTREEQNVIQAVQGKVFTGALYETKIRFLALSPHKSVGKYLSYPANFFKQLTFINGYKPDADTKTSQSSIWLPILDRLYWDYEKVHRQKRIYYAVRSRDFSASGKPHMQTSDALAAMIHFPLQTEANQDLLLRVGSNFGNTLSNTPKGQIPKNLPV